MATRGVNKVILIGNLGNNPDVRFTPSGGAIANLSVATSESWKDRNTGQTQEKTEWHRVVIFGKLAEIAQQYLRKGSKVYLEGKLQTRKWQDQQGQDRYSTEVVIDGFNGQMQMLDGRQDGAEMGAYQPSAENQLPKTQPSQNPSMQNQQTNEQSAQRHAPSSAPPTQTKQLQPESFDNFDDDIPF